VKISAVFDGQINFKPGDDLSGTYEAIVKIGNWESVGIRKLSKIKEPMEPTLIGAIGVVAGVIIIIVVFCIVVYFRRKSRQKDEHLKPEFFKIISYACIFDQKFDL